MAGTLVNDQPCTILKAREISAGALAVWRALRRQNPQMQHGHLYSAGMCAKDSACFTRWTSTIIAKTFDSSRLGVPAD